MEFLSLFLIAGVIVLVLLALRFLKGAFRIVTSIVGILVVLIGILSFVAYKDVQTLNGLMDGEKTFVYEEDGTYLAGVTIGSGTRVVVDQGVPGGLDAFSAEELSSYEPPTGKDELQVIVTAAVFENLTLNFSNQTISKEEFDTYMHSPDPVLLFATKQAEEEGVPQEQVDAVAQATAKEADVSPEEFRAVLFVAALQSEMRNESASFLIDNVQQEDIEIYPELTTVKLLQFIPGDLAQQAIDKAVVTEEDA